MAFQRPTLQELIDRIQGDFVSRLALSGAVLRRSVVYVFARVWAGAAHTLHGHLAFISRQIFADLSEAEYLERHGTLFGITRKAAAFASGDVTLTGDDGAIVPAETTLQRADGVEYVTAEDAAIAGGSATVVVTALTAGAAGNADPGVSLSLVSPVGGVDSAATVAAGSLTNGADPESDNALRVRVLARMRQPPHGGADFDYVTWALEVASVTRAWVYPLEMGEGTVTVRFVVDDDPGGPIPDAPKVEEVQAYIEARRPVTAEVFVEAPIETPLDMTIQLTPDTAATRAAVAAELEDLLRREAEPGGTILLSHIREAISIAEGEVDHVVTIPAADVTHATGELAVLGTITWA
jgi:uncharacterized phage protein gp47/JayE